jgi:hypothetical protein
MMENNNMKNFIMKIFMIMTIMRKTIYIYIDAYIYVCVYYAHQ